MGKARKIRAETKTEFIVDPAALEYLKAATHITSLRDLARKAGIAPSEVSRMLNSKHHLTLDDVETLATASGLSREKFLQIIGFLPS
jgi:antitoxin component HigA of HigAB toxin-antitoxin module